MNVLLTGASRGIGAAARIALEAAGAIVASHSTSGTDDTVTARAKQIISGGADAAAGAGEEDVHGPAVSAGPASLRAKRGNPSPAAGLLRFARNDECCLIRLHVHRRAGAGHTRPTRMRNRRCRYSTHCTPYGPAVDSTDAKVVQLACVPVIPIHFDARPRVAVDLD